MTDLATSLALVSNFPVILSFLLILLLLCLLIILLIHNQSKPITNNNCLLVVAHPDDETMFFGPTIQNMNTAQLFVLCITSGNSDKLGQIRQNELEKAIVRLGIPSKHLYFLDKDEKNFRDGFTHKWDTKFLCQSILEYLMRLDCRSAVTFDDYGVSGHPNHIACFQALKLLLEQWSEPNPPPQIFVLESVSIWRKYASFIDLIAGYIDCKYSPGKLICVASPCVMWKAMREHRSQLVWFRYLYMVFSRYVIINTLRRLQLVNRKLE